LRKENEDDRRSKHGIYTTSSKSLGHEAKDYGVEDQNVDDRAIEDCDQAMKLDPKDANPYYNRGLVKLKKGDKAGGDADIAKARQLNPKVGQ
jgi:Flp pilus assembly protein TadD